MKVSKGTKIRNRYNQVPHLTQDTNGKVTNSQFDTTNENMKPVSFSSPFAISHCLAAIFFSFLYMTSNPKTLAQIQYNFAQMLLVRTLPKLIPKYKNEISSWTVGPNWKQLHKNYPHKAIYQEKKWVCTGNTTITHCKQPTAPYRRHKNRTCFTIWSIGPNTNDSHRHIYDTPCFFYCPLPKVLKFKSP